VESKDENSKKKKKENFEKEFTKKSNTKSIKEKGGG
jgi:hypothetical protein